MINKPYVKKYDENGTLLNPIPPNHVYRGSEVVKFDQWKRENKEIVERWKRPLI